MIIAKSAIMTVRRESCKRSIMHDLMTTREEERKGRERNKRVQRAADGER
jgi:hypothetical protein